MIIIDILDDIFTKIAPVFYVTIGIALMFCAFNLGKIVKESETIITIEGAGIVQLGDHFYKAQRIK